METNAAVLGGIREEDPLEVEIKEIQICEARAERRSEQALERWHKLTLVLRRLGGLVLIASAITFVIQKWYEVDPLSRYFTFLGFTVVLSGFGVYCGLKLKDDKGARTLLAIAASFLPAHFIHVGALLYSVLLDKPAEVPKLFLVQAPSLASAVLTVAAAALVMIPVLYLGLSAMARSEAKRLTAAIAFSNAFLLLPIRDPGLIGLISFALFATVIYIDRQWFSKQAATKTWDARAMRSMLFLPSVLLIIRNLMLYNPTSLFLSCVFAVIAVSMFFIAGDNLGNQHTSEFFQGASVIPLAISWLFFADGVLLAREMLAFYSVFGLGLWDLWIPLNLLPLSLILFALSFAAVGEGLGYRRLSSFLAISAVLVQLFSVGGIFSSLLCILTATVLIGVAFALEEKWLFYSGTVGLSLGLLYHLRYAADLYNLSPWLSLAVTGLATVLAASYLEKNARALISRSMAFKASVSSWK